MDAKTQQLIEKIKGNAGLAQQKLFTDITDEDWKRMMDVDLGGAFYCCRAALPDMIRALRKGVEPQRGV